MAIILTENRQAKKLGTKTVYITTETKENEITEEQYNNYLSSCSFFRRLGGSETVTKSYTSRGYKPVKLVSVSPDRSEKVIREFKFI